MQVMKKKIITIILPSYNHKKYLKERLDSIFNQSFQDFEVILLDDASTDGSEKLLMKYKNHSKVSHCIINEENSGSPFKQWKKGLALAKGEFIWIAESDDYCDLNFLEEQIELLQKNAADIAVAATKKVNKNKKVFGATKHPIFREKDELCITNDYFLYCPILNVSAVVFKKSLLLGVKNYFNYSLIGDRVFYFEAFHNRKIILNKNTNSYFRKDGDSVSTLSEKNLKYFLQYYKEHHEFALSALRANKINKNLYQKYITRFFNRVNNRLSRLEKLSFTYLKLRWKYKQDMKKAI